MDLQIKKNTLEIAKEVIAVEIDALQNMSEQLNGDFQKAIDIVLETKGRVVVVGMGKSGLIGQKIMATLASTGTPAFSVHPGEAFHGDLGMIKPVDVLLMISNSGETEELVRLLPFLLHQNNCIIAMTGNPNSTLARHAEVVLNISVPKEACNNNLAPTSSTTATLVMGDALAVALSTIRCFQPEDFARFHPGGNLGRKLLTKVADVMHKENLPVCMPESSFRDILQIITRGRLGFAVVMDGHNICGIITDGDIRRAFDKAQNPLNIQAHDFMTRNPKTISMHERFSTAEELMRSEKIQALVVINPVDQRLVGVLQIFDIDSESYRNINVNN